MLTRSLRNIYSLPIHLYKKCISPFLPQSCRFYPSCSTYALEAIQVHGVIKGTLYGIWRILRCNSLSAGGFDPVLPLHQRNKH